MPRTLFPPSRIQYGFEGLDGVARLFMAPAMNPRTVCFCHTRVDAAPLPLEASLHRPGSPASVISSSKLATPSKVPQFISKTRYLLIGTVGICPTKFSLLFKCVTKK